MIHISKGNSKLGSIPNISYNPEITCVSASCRTDGCYAMKAYRQYPAVRKAWSDNLDDLFTYPQGHQALIETWIIEHSKRKVIRRFRWCVGGDITGIIHADMIVDIAKTLYLTDFTIYTKKPGFFKASIKPPNLHIFTSQWPGDPLRTSPYPNAWVQDGTEDRIPKGQYECPGSCKTCNYCYSTGNTPQDVIFHKH